MNGEDIKNEGIPDVNKLKGKYSPRRKLDSPQRGPSEALAKKYKMFAISPGRKGVRSVENSRSGEIEKLETGRLLQAPVRLPPSSSSEEDSEYFKGRRRQKVYSPTRRHASPDTLGGSVRTSGSPLRRLTIAEIEQQCSPKRWQMEEGRAKAKVSFNQDVKFNDTSGIKKLNDLSDTSVDTLFVNKVDEDDKESLRKAIKDVATKIESVEETQQNILRFINDATTRLQSQLDDLKKTLNNMANNPNNLS